MTDLDRVFVPAAVVPVELARVLVLHRLVLRLRDRDDRHVERLGDPDLVGRRLVFAVARFLVGRTHAERAGVDADEGHADRVLDEPVRALAAAGARPAAGERSAAGGA